MVGHVEMAIWKHIQIPATSNALVYSSPILISKPPSADPEWEERILKIAVWSSLTLSLRTTSQSLILATQAPTPAIVTGASSDEKVVAYTITCHQQIEEGPSGEHGQCQLRVGNIHTGPRTEPCETPSFSDCGWEVAPCSDEYGLRSVRQIGPEPLKCGTTDALAVMQRVFKQGMICSVQRSRQIKQDQYCLLSTASRMPLLARFSAVCVLWFDLYADWYSS